MRLETTCELERRRLDPGDVYKWWSALDLAALVPAGHQSTVDGDLMAGISVQVHGVAAQHVEGVISLVGYCVGPYW